MDTMTGPIHAPFASEEPPEHLVLLSVALKTIVLTVTACCSYASARAA